MQQVIAMTASLIDCRRHTGITREGDGSAAAEAPPPQRPSRSQVAARLPTRSSRPEQAGEHRQHADAAHDARVAHLEADPVVAVEGVARAHRQHARHVHARGGFDAPRIAPGRRRQGGEHVGGRGHLGELARIGRADVDEGIELAVVGVP
jgi:hypothetical protein